LDDQALVKMHGWPGHHPNALGKMEKILKERLVMKILQ